jgi:hypothetical protein
MTGDNAPKQSGYEAFAALALTLPDDAVVSRYFAGLVLDNVKDDRQTFRINTDDLVGGLFGAISALEVRLLKLEAQQKD